MTVTRTLTSAQLPQLRMFIGGAGVIINVCSYMRRVAEASHMWDYIHVSDPTVAVYHGRTYGARVGSDLSFHEHNPLLMRGHDADVVPL